MARRDAAQPAKIQDVAKTQQISPRFLEGILNQLRHAGIVESRRGSDGGYLLARPALTITVGEIVRCIQGPIAIAGRDRKPDKNAPQLFGEEAFEQLWGDIDAAVNAVCDTRTLADLLESAAENQRQTPIIYVI